MQRRRIIVSLVGCIRGHPVLRFQTNAKSWSPCALHLVRAPPAFLGAFGVPPAPGTLPLFSLQFKSFTKMCTHVHQRLTCRRSLLLGLSQELDRAACPNRIVEKHELRGTRIRVPPTEDSYAWVGGLCITGGVTTKAHRKHIAGGSITADIFKLAAVMLE